MVVEICENGGIFAQCTERQNDGKGQVKRKKTHKTQNTNTNKTQRSREGKGGEKKKASQNPGEIKEAALPGHRDKGGKVQTKTPSERRGKQVTNERIPVRCTAAV